jgi:hypothetical protein
MAIAPCCLHACNGTSATPIFFTRPKRKYKLIDYSRAREAAPGNDIDNNDVASRMDINDTETIWNNAPHSSVIDEDIEFFAELNSDYYVSEGTDVNRYLRPSMSNDMQEDKRVH